MSAWYKATFGIEPKLPLRCSMTDKEWNARQNRWRRRYPGLESWLDAHRGEAAGRLVGTMPPVTYWTELCNGKRYYHWCPTDRAAIRYGDTPEITEAEFHDHTFAPQLDHAGNPYCRAAYVPCPEIDGQPSWPPTPEEWVRGMGMNKVKKFKRQTRPIPTTKAEAITSIWFLMAGFGIAVEEISPQSNGKQNGYAGRYEALAKSLANTSVRLPSFEAWIERVKAHENRNGETRR